jgi:uncharacterized protein YjbI with pentapeptide repeats
MRQLISVLSGLLFCLVIIAPPVTAQKQEEKEWTGKLADGTIITEEDLREILRKHEQWVETNGKEGQQANLSGADLRKVNLSEAFLIDADLSKAELQEANLAKAYLQMANLNKADLRGANLNGAKLQAADLTKADLNSADVRAADLSNAKLTNSWWRNADLSNATLDRADLSEADLTKTNLTGVKLNSADLRGATLHGATLFRGEMNFADFSNAKLWAVDLNEADLTGAILKNADMGGAKLRKAALYEVVLNNARLERADLSEAYMTGADLSGVNFRVADLSGATFEPLEETLPQITLVATAKNLHTMKYDDFPQGLVRLREEFKKLGLRKQEREITHAIMYTQVEKQIERGKTLEQARGYIKRVFFDLTCQYGMSPLRPLVLLLLGIPLFSVLYMIALRMERSSGDIWKVWPEDRMHKHEGSQDRQRLRVRGLWLLWFGFYFSILSAFHIGWRDFNVGNWISRLQPREYTFRATGWVRTVSGIQSLISVYMLALFALTYFGRPFDSF